jgi:hypothetical protein
VLLVKLAKLLFVEATDGLVVGRCGVVACGMLLGCDGTETKGLEAGSQARSRLANGMCNWVL